MSKVKIIPTGTSCNIHSKGWNYFYFGFSMWDAIIANRESDKTPINDDEYQIINQVIKVPHIKNKQIVSDESYYPTFDENKALEIVENALENGTAIIQISYEIVIPIMRIVKI